MVFHANFFPWFFFMRIFSHFQFLISNFSALFSAATKSKRTLQSTDDIYAGAGQSDGDAAAASTAAGAYGSPAGPTAGPGPTARPGLDGSSPAADQQRAPLWTVSALDGTAGIPPGTGAAAGVDGETTGRSWHWPCAASSRLQSRVRGMDLPI